MQVALSEYLGEVRSREVRAKGVVGVPFQTEGASDTLHHDILFQVANPNLHFGRHFSMLGVFHSRAQTRVQITCHR